MRLTWEAFGNFVFCAGVVILPAVAMAYFTAWVACQTASGSRCLEMMSDSIVQASMAELGVIGMPAPFSR